MEAKTDDKGIFPFAGRGAEKMSEKTSEIILSRTITTQIEWNGAQTRRPVRRAAAFYSLAKQVEIESGFPRGFFFGKGIFWRRFGSDLIGLCNWIVQPENIRSEPSPTIVLINLKR